MNGHGVVLVHRSSFIVHRCFLIRMKLFASPCVILSRAKKGGLAMSKRVLICEDDSAIRLLLDKLLTRHGFLSECVPNGADAAARLRRESFDLIVLDLLTPAMTGYEVVDLLRRERPHLLDRVVVVTAQRPSPEPLPVAAVVRKPFDVTEFDRVVDGVVHRAANGYREQRPRAGEGAQ